MHERNNLNRPRDLSLTTEDIEGAKSRSRSFKTRRCTNPLNPEYKLASVYIPPTLDIPLRQGGLPTNYVGDIDKCKPRKLFNNTQRDTMSVSDIAFTEPNHYRRRLRPLPSEHRLNGLDVRDINGSNNTHERDTNPLDPVYNSSVGPIEGSKPRAILKNYIPPPAPIEGSIPQQYIGTMPHSIYNPKTIDERPLPTGSRANTLKKGLESKRRTNPVNPGYRCLEGNPDSSCEILSKCKVN